MKDLNCVQLIGRVGQDPEVQYTDHGIACTTFSVATSCRWTGHDMFNTALRAFQSCMVPPVARDLGDAPASV